MFGRRRKSEGGRKGASGRDVFEDLRTQLISIDPESIGLSPTERFPRVWGCLMEQGIDGEVATLVSLADGSTSLYTSTGGGVIGGGDHQQIADASKAFLDTVEAAFDVLQPSDEVPLPGTDEVRFNALTYAGRRTSSASYDDCARQGHPLHGLFASAQDVLTELRLIEKGPQEMT